MRLAYLAPSDIQVARVDRRCIVSFCEALQRAGVEVELIALGIKTLDGEPTSADPLDLYGVRDPFRTTIVRTPVRQTSNSAWIMLNRLAVHAFGALRVRSEGDDAALVFYTKTNSTILLLLALRRLKRGRFTVVFEAHVFPRTVLQRFAVRYADYVIANSNALASELTETGAAKQSRIVATHQGVDLERIGALRLSRAEAREAVGLADHRRLVVYTGKIYEGYAELEYILEAARMLAHRADLHFVLVGGRADHVGRVRARLAREGVRNVTLTGFVPPQEVHAYQFAASALILYYPSGLALNRYRSPGKLFEYMAVGRPIVAVDLPVLREVLPDDGAVFVKPDAPNRLAQAVTRVVDDEQGADAMAERARSAVQRFSWDARAGAVLQLIAGGPASPSPAPMALTRA